MYIDVEAHSKIQDGPGPDVKSHMSLESAPFAHPEKYWVISVFL